MSIESQRVSAEFQVLFTHFCDVKKQKLIADNPARQEYLETVQKTYNEKISELVDLFKELRNFSCRMGDIEAHVEDEDVKTMKTIWVAMSSGFTMISAQEKMTKLKIEIPALEALISSLLQIGGHFEKMSQYTDII